MVSLGEFRPDIEAVGDHLVTCRNVYPTAEGYGPFNGLSAATGTLPAAWVGGGAFQYNGTNAMLGATAAGLYSHSGGVWTSKLVVATSAPWHFRQFGDIVICTNGSTVVKYTISTGIAANLGGTPPSAAYSAIVRNFVMLAGNGSADQTVYNSAIENAEGWTIGGSQADSQIIADGGPITGLSGGEFGLVFQAAQITIAEYVGTPLIFTYRKVSDQIGATCHGSIVQHNRRVYFHSFRGFHYYEDGQVVPIGIDKIDDTFIAAYSLSQLRASMRCTVDPKRKLVIWSMPDRLWIYHMDRERWTVVDISGLVGICVGLTASATLESIAVTFPSLEDVTPNLDDAFWNGDGQPLMLLIKTDGIGYTFSSGETLEATFKTAKMEPFRGRRAHTRNVWLDSDTVSMTLNIDCSQRQGDSQTRFTSADFSTNGDIPIRASGRFQQLEFIIGAGDPWSNGDIPIRASGRFQQLEFIIGAGDPWSYFMGFEIEASQGGRQ